MKSLNLKSVKDKFSDIVVRLLPDKLYLQMVYRRNMGQRLNLKNPVTFQEKIQWLKLYNRRPEYTRMVDKYAAKEYVESVIGADYIIPTLGVWNKAEDIDFDSLPDKFVLKTTHDSGGVVVCRDKSALDKSATISMLRERLKHKIYYHNREWPYKNVTPRIIAEQYMEDESGYELKDYKIFCFNGEPKFLKVDFNRYIKHRANYYDTEWNLLPFYEKDYPNDAAHVIERPQNFTDMLRLAKDISKGIPFVRIDLYNIRGKIFFGEITFFPASGLGVFSPDQWNVVIGQMIDLEVFRGGKWPGYEIIVWDIWSADRYLEAC